jgi:glycolate oxidase iron-sulfur subunit
MTARGRLRLVSAVAKGRLEPTKALKKRITSCILCGRCMESCPAGVDIMEILYKARSEILGSTLVRFAARQALHPARLDRLVRVAGRIHGPFTRRLSAAGRFRIIPPLPPQPFRHEHQVFKPKKRRGRVALFVGCVINYVYPEMGEDTVSILLNLGYEVVVIRGEVCCGAPHRELGDHATFVKLAEKNLELFGKIRAEAVVTGCPTCALTLRDHYPKHVPDAGRLAARVKDITAFLYENIDDLPLDSGLSRLVYHDPCHLRYGLDVRDEPRKLLDGTGAEVVEMGRESACCGFGGLFGMAHYDFSQRIGAARRAEALKTGVKDVVTSCPGCVLQFQDAFKADEGVRVWHTVEVIRKAMGGERGEG